MSPAPLSIIFLGTSDFAVPSLRAIAGDDRFSILAVITQTDKPAGRDRTLTPPPVKVEAIKHRLPVLQPKDIREEFSALQLPRPDFLVVVSYGQILSQEILDFPRIAPVNVHASLLPRWRGASPIQHAILAGDAETGVTIQRMVKELDAGPIYAQKNLVLDPRETTPALHDKLKILGAELLVETLAVLPEARPQQGEISVCKKLSRENGKCDTLTMTAEEIDRKVRALTPWPCVTCTILNESIKLLETSLLEKKQSHPLQCKDGSTLHLVLVQPPGRTPMAGAAWARGKR